MNFEVKTKKALFLNGKQITDYAWDHFDIDNIHEVIVATNNEKKFALFNLAGDLLFEIENCLNYDICEHGIIIKTIYRDFHFYGMLSFDGKFLIAPIFTSLRGTKCKNVIKLKIGDMIEGYYIASTDQAVMCAKEFEVISDEEYNFFIDDEWYKYILVDGKYQMED